MEEKSLYMHVKHPHKPRNINEVHTNEQTGFNTRLAVLLTRSVGTMQMAYVFALIGIGSLVGVFTGNVFLALLFGSISSYFLQLVLLPILSVGQNVLSRHQEMQAEELYNTTIKDDHNIEQIALHLSAQDAKILELEQKISGDNAEMKSMLLLLKSQGETRVRKRKIPLELPTT